MHCHTTRGASQRVDSISPRRDSPSRLKHSYWRSDERLPTCFSDCSLTKDSSLYTSYGQNEAAYGAGLQGGTTDVAGLFIGNSLSQHIASMKRALNVGTADACLLVSEPAYARTVQTCRRTPSYYAYASRDAVVAKGKEWPYEDRERWWCGRTGTDGRTDLSARTVLSKS